MRKTRINPDGAPSPLALLKRVAQEDPEEIEWLQEMSKTASARHIIVQIEARHGIHGLTVQRLSDFWRWLSEQQEIRAANASVANLREIFEEVMPGAGREETHRFLLRFLAAQGFGTRDHKLIQFVAVEERKAVQLAQEREKFQFDAAQAALACLPALRKIQADKTLDDKSRVTEARKALFGVTPE
jgi:hypothetical protein